MHRSALLSLALALSVAGVLLGTPPSVVEAAPARPDIVMFYIDDWAPYPARMWNKESRTPALARFADKGMEFRNAIASTPLCGPARANILTGQYGHNNGVTQNGISKYSGSELISTTLRGAGYRTAFVGKHLNGLTNRYATRGQMRALANKWNQFDVIWHNQGRYYDWRQYRKDGTRSFGSKPTDHSSYQAAQRAMRAIRDTPKDKPLFLVVSLYDGHKPRIPMARFKGRSDCRGMAWAGPAYNEKDVSDKPKYVQKFYRRGVDSFSLTTRCEEALTIDWVVGKIYRTLWQNGRLKNTLQVLTADNGYLMGDHRIMGKTYPYDTRVPLYMSWPAVMGHSKRVVSEPVSNIDLPQTFCALAGCQLPGSDGESLVPLIKSKSDRIDRSFLWSEMLHASPNYGQAATGRPAWMQVHSTRKYSNRLWTYTRYQTGEEELYDISADPHKLQNLARESKHSAVLADMRDFYRSVRDRDRVRWKGKMY